MHAWVALRILSEMHSFFTLDMFQGDIIVPNFYPGGGGRDLYCEFSNHLLSSCLFRLMLFAQASAFIIANERTDRLSTRYTRRSGLQLDQGFQGRHCKAETVDIQRR